MNVEPAVAAVTEPGARADAGTTGEQSPATTESDDGAATAIAARLREHLDALGSLDEVGLGEHVDFYQRVHGELRSALSDIDDA